MLHWLLIHLASVAEAGICVIFFLPTAPVFLKKTIIGWTQDPKVLKGAKIYCAIVGFLWGETCIELLLKSAPKTTIDPEAFHHFEVDNLKNQRNAMGAFASLFLLIMIKQVAELTKNCMKLQSDTEVLKKQAGNVSSEYMRLLNEKSGSTGDTSNDATAALKQENTKLKQRAEELEASAAKAQQEVQVIKKQAENQQAAFAKLTEDNKSLANKLEDFNLMFGDDRKKRV